MKKLPVYYHELDAIYLARVVKSIYTNNFHHALQDFPNLLYTNLGLGYV